MNRHRINQICERALAGITRGERDALSMIYDAIGKQIYFLAYSLLQNHHDAEDVLQQTLIEIVRSAHTYRKGENASAWILAIARNQALKLGRSRKTVPLAEIETEAQAFDTSLTLDEALATLESDERQVVVLHVFSGMKHKEIAELLQISVSSAEKKYQRAIAKLRVLL